MLNAADFVFPAKGPDGVRASVYGPIAGSIGLLDR